MYHLLTLKRKIKVLLVHRGGLRGHRSTTFNYQEYSDIPERPNDSCKRFIILSLLIVTLYCLFYFTADPYIKITRPGVQLERMYKKYIKHEANVVDRFIIINYPENVSTIENLSESNITDEKRKHLPMCVITLGGNVTVLRKVDPSPNDFPMVQSGGYYRPPDCRSKHKVAILVPYRNRQENLVIFLYNLHPFLMRQNLEYRIFVIEQAGRDLFNKGRIFNAGVLEIQKFGHWPCFIFHDVDLLPTNDQILYTCPIIPRHMCPSVVEMEKKKNFRTIFGGVTSMTMAHFKKVNGYSNRYWGWGGEDDDMYRRLKLAKVGIRRYRKDVARYTSLVHPTSPRNPIRYLLLEGTVYLYKKDGLSDLKYNVISYSTHRLYTTILVDINPNHENVTQIED